MRFEHMVDDRQPETTAFDIMDQSGAHAMKAVKYALLLLLADADAAVFYGDHRLVAFLLQANLNVATVARVFRRVV